MKWCALLVALVGCGSGGHAPGSLGDGAASAGGDALFDGNMMGGPDLKIRCPPEKLEKCPKNQHGAPSINFCTDAQHCGGCFMPCQTPNATPVCADAVCRIAACHPGWSDCDGQLFNGCERQGSCPVPSDLGAPPDAAPSG